MGVHGHKTITNNFTIVSNDIIRNPELSPRARWLLIYILSHSEEWSMTIGSIATLNKVGRAQIASSLKELKDAGYARVEQTHSKNGNFSENDWQVYDYPKFSEEPDMLAVDVDSVDAKSVDAKQQHKKTNNKEDQVKELSASASEPKGSDVSTGNPYTPEFEEWWEHYPKKEAKRDALKAFKAIRKEASLEDLIRSTKRYSIVVRDRERRFIKKPAGWLRSGMWEDTLGNTGGSSTNTIQRPDIAPLELSRKEVNDILGPDNYSPLEPAELRGTREGSEWKKRKLDEHFKARQQQAMEKINGK